MAYTTKIAGIDVTSYITDKPNLSVKKNDVGELVEVPNITLIAFNERNIFTVGNTQSIFESDSQGESVEILEGNETVYSGEVRQCTPAQNKMVNIETTAKINQILNLTMPSYIAAQKTFSEHSWDIYGQFGISVDSHSYLRAKEFQEDNILQCRVNIPVTSVESLLSIQQFLANAGLCRHYFIGDTAYMEVGEPISGPSPMHTFGDSEILEITGYSLIESPHYDGYNVLTDAGTAYLYGDEIATLDCGSDKNFVMPTSEAGINWGEAMIRITGTKRHSISITLAVSKYTQWMSSQSIFRVESDYMGIYENFEVVGLDYSSNLGITISGESV